MKSATKSATKSAVLRLTQNKNTTWLAIALIGGLLPVMGACAGDLEPVTTKNSSLTQGNVQLSVRVGQTTQAEILTAFGAPNVTTRAGDGREVWTYQRAAQVSQSKRRSGLFGITLFGGIGGIGGIGRKSTSGFETSSRMMTLVIKFDEGGVVADFNSRSANF